MAWIRTILPDAATGLLERLYRDSIKRAGRVFNIISVQSLQPEVLRASNQLYMAVMYGPKEPLSRAQREMIAAAVSQVNDCYY